MISSSLLLACLMSIFRLLSPSQLRILLLKIRLVVTSILDYAASIRLCNHTCREKHFGNRAIQIRQLLQTNGSMISWKCLRKLNALMLVYHVRKKFVLGLIKIPKMLRSNLKGRPWQLALIYRRSSTLSDKLIVLETCNYRQVKFKEPLKKVVIINSID